MDSRQAHRAEVLSYIRRAFPANEWTLSVPRGTGHETYFAHSGSGDLFIKLNSDAMRLSIAGQLGLTPPLLAEGRLSDGTVITVQPRIAGRTPTCADLQARLETVALAVFRLHNSEELKSALPPVASGDYRALALDALQRIRSRWGQFRENVLTEAPSVDRALDLIRERIEGFTGSGPVASHNDICNANWIFDADGRVYLVDMDAMSLEDPACDLGAILWWYYPPYMRDRFLKLAAPVPDPDLPARMRTRMAMHALSITLPREGSFDTFDPTTYQQSLTDFRALLRNEENPQGYG